MSRKTSSERSEPAFPTAGVCEGRRALVVDPDADTRALYREALRMAGCDVVEAADGRDALTKALVWPPAIVITELRLPLLNGFALCEILRRDRVTATVPIVVVTGETRDAELEHVHRIGGNSVIVKPTTPDALLSAVRRLLSVRQPPNETIADSVAPARQDGNKRMTLTKLHQRCATTTPPESPPSLVCPSCDRPLVFVHSYLGGVSVKHPEQWDDFDCPSCGRFEYRHRTRKLRRVQ
jgi:CheY-like chemotaxis protein